MRNNCFNLLFPLTTC